MQKMEHKLSWKTQKSSINSLIFTSNQVQKMEHKLSWKTQIPQIELNMH